MRESRVNQAVELYAKCGYNCSQAVAMAYCDLLDLDPLTTFKGMEAFGGGMGARNGTCGAISGAIYLAGFAKSTGNLSHDKSNKSKGTTSILSSDITKSFLEEYGSITCCDLKNAKGPHFTSCMECVKAASLLVETKVFPDEFEVNI